MMYLIIILLFSVWCAEQKKQKVSEVKAGIDEAEALVLYFSSFLKDGFIFSADWDFNIVVLMNL